MKKHELFNLLNPDEMDQVSRISSRKLFDAGQRIYRGKNEHFFVLLVGSVVLRSRPEGGGEDFVLSRLVPGQVFGLSALLGASQHSAIARAETDCEILVIEAREFREILRSNHQVGFTIMNLVAERYFSRYLDLMHSLQGIVEQISRMQEASWTRGATTK